MKILIKIICVLSTLALWGGVFYWFEYRPAEIRKACVNKIKKIGAENNLTVLEANGLFDLCIKSKGLEK